ncbi:MAG: sigma-70 family RNA polymerase sigma factor [Chloroflexota bacterium]|nr:MAG: sigma-70 family RNA polymerase sigma factor [Chloroflexota bacterium]
MDYRKLDDQTLIRLVSRSQELALSELYERYKGLVYSIAMHAVGNNQLAEEITQDVFLRVWQKADTYQPSQGKVYTWLASIARYRAIDVIRWHKIRPESALSAWEDLESRNISNGSDIESQSEFDLRAEKIRRALYDLPEDQRKVLAYAYFRGYSQSEIAELLELPLGTVKTRIRLGMQKLRFTLYEEEDIPE